jgi:hypothetical protein
VKRYNNATKELGYGQLIPQSTFYDGNDGYREQDTGTFGAEIYIVKPAQQKEKVTFISNPPDNVFTWKILHFSTLEDKVYQSNEFLVGDRYWLVIFVTGYFRPKSKLILKACYCYVTFTVLLYNQEIRIKPERRLSPNLPICSRL